MRTLAHLLLLVALACGYTGCGYRAGFMMPDGIHRLSVPIFANETFPLRREVEYDLTRAVKQELEVRTDVMLVSGVDRADAVLKGTVVSFRESTLTEGVFDEVRDATIHVVVRIRLERSGNGGVILDKEVHDQEDFSVLRGQTIDDARAVALQEIAERVVAALEVW